MNQSCVILGAGFSKALAKLPLTNELFDRFKIILEEQRKNNGHFFKRGVEIFDFQNRLKEKINTYYNKISQGGNITTKDFLNDFEGICTFIDFNLAFELHVLTQKGHEVSDLTGLPLFAELPSTTLSLVRGYIADYLYLTFVTAQLDEKLLEKLYDKVLFNSSAVITFNYDLILEKFLFLIKKWYPSDGYGIKTKFSQELNPKYNGAKSEIEILKLHGSINWNIQDDSCDYIDIELTDIWGNHFFPEYLHPDVPKNYYGIYSSSTWFLPSWIKQFQYPQVVDIWHKASDKLNNSEEVYFIGYSLPKPDSAVYALLSTIDFSNKNVTIVDPSADLLKPNFAKILRKNDILTVSKNLEVYLNK